LQPKIHQISFGAWALPRPAGELTALPSPLAGFRGILLRGEGKGREGKGRGFGRGKSLGGNAEKSVCSPRLKTF